MHKISRREFIKIGASSAAILSTPSLLTNCRLNKNPLGPSKPEGTNATVAAIRGNDLGKMTRDALEAIGGMNKIVNEGETVFIKPNMVTLPWAPQNDCFMKGECTKPEIVMAVAEECLKAGAAKVIIGEGSHLYTFNWRNAEFLTKSNNILYEATKLNSIYPGEITVACLENDSPSWVEVPSKSNLGKIAISSLVANADRVISIPVAKTHSWAQLTLSLKNFIGITPLKQYAVWVNNSYWDRGSVLDHSSPQALAQIYLDIAKAIKPDLAVIDFSIGIEGDGPTSGSGGTVVNMKHRLGSYLVVASTDLIAADSTAALVMNHDVRKMKQLTIGYEMGLGEMRSEAIEIIGEKLQDIMVDWKPAKLQNNI